MGNMYSRLQSVSSANGAPDVEERVEQSSTRNDAIVVYYEMGMDDFKKWYNTARYFNVESVVRKYANLEVGMTKEANLNINISKGGGSDQIRIEIINKSEFEICLGGEIYCVEGRIRPKIINGKASIWCPMLLRILASKSTTIDKSNLHGYSNHNVGKRSTDLFLDVSEIVPQNVTLAFLFKFFPLNCASKNVSKMKTDGASALIRDISELRDNTEIGDVTINCDKKYFIAHKIILSARSSVFAAMFRHRGTTERDTGVVTVEDCDENTMEMFLAYVYGGKLPEYTFDVAASLINVATKYNVHSLMDMCTEILEGHLNEGNAIKVVLLGDLYSVETLKSAALAVIAESKKPLKAMNGWEDLDQFQELKIEIIDFKARC